MSAKIIDLGAYRRAREWDAFIAERLERCDRIVALALSIKGYRGDHVAESALAERRAWLDVDGEAQAENHDAARDAIRRAIEAQDETLRKATALRAGS